MKSRFLRLLMPFAVSIACFACGNTYETADQTPAGCPAPPPAEGSACQSNDDCPATGVCFIAACLDGGCVPRKRLDGAACNECGYAGTCQNGTCTETPK